MKGWIGFDQVTAAGDCHRRRGGAYLQANVESNGHRGADHHVLGLGGKTTCLHNQVIRILRQVGELEPARGIGHGVRESPLTGFSMVTAAPGTTAPEESVTVPTTVPEFPADWARRVTGNEDKKEDEQKGNGITRRDAHGRTSENSDFLN